MYTYVGVCVCMGGCVYMCVCVGVCMCDLTLGHEVEDEGSVGDVRAPCTVVTRLLAHIRIHTGNLIWNKRQQSAP